MRLLGSLAVAGLLSLLIGYIGLTGVVDPNRYGATIMALVGCLALVLGVGASGVGIRSRPKDLDS